MTHIIPATARAVQKNQFRALCGALVDGDQHARDGRISCLECARLDAEDEASLLALSQATQESFGGPPVKSTWGNPTAGYRPRGQRR